MKKLLFIFFCTICYLSATAQKDTIITKKGKTIICTITFINQSFLYYQIKGEDIDEIEITKVSHFTPQPVITPQPVKNGQPLSIEQPQNDSASNKNSIAKNVVYIEALGNGCNILYGGTLGTVNYERNIIYSEDFNCAIRVGLGFSNAFYYYSLPLMFNIISNPNGDHHLDFGLGIVVTNAAWFERKNYEVGYTWNLTYRYQKKTEGIYFSAGWTPSIYFDPYFNEGPKINHFFFDVIPHFLMIGISIGKHF